MYVSYWSLGDALTEATVFPNLNILRLYCSRIYLATIERNVDRTTLPEGIVHIPFHSVTWLPRVVEKLIDILFFSIKLIHFVRKEDIKILICRGAMAAMFGLVLNRTFGLPFMVESFEPHAEYMVEGNTWKRSGFEYKFQRWIETQTRKKASYLMPVSNNYKEELIRSGISPARIVVMPCCVNAEKFAFNSEVRLQVRGALGICEQSIVGIYVGKFGDLYLKGEAFRLFKEVNDFFRGNFFLIVLSPQEATTIKNSLQAVGFPLEKCFVAKVENKRVPDFLSAADFAFSLARPAPSGKYLSPVKNGEYWANGLPIILSKGVGDDEAIILKYNAGVIFDPSSICYQTPLGLIKELVSQDRAALARKISGLARHYRGFEIIEEGYEKIFAQLKGKLKN